MRPPKGRVPAKVGTIPMTVTFDRRTNFEVGCRVKWKELVGGKWQRGILTNVDPIRITRM